MVYWQHTAIFKHVYIYIRDFAYTYMCVCMCVYLCVHMRISCCALILVARVVSHSSTDSFAHSSSRAYLLFIYMYMVDGRFADACMCIYERLHQNNVRKSLVLTPQKPCRSATGRLRGWRWRGPGTEPGRQCLPSLMVSGSNEPLQIWFLQFGARGLGSGKLEPSV